MRIRLQIWWTPASLTSSGIGICLLPWALRLIATWFSEWGVPSKEPNIVAEALKGDARGNGGFAKLYAADCGGEFQREFDVVLRGQQFSRIQAFPHRSTTHGHIERIHNLQK